MRIWGKWGWSITAIVLLGACSDSSVSTTTTTEPPSTVTVASSTSTLATTTTTAPEVTTTTIETVEVLLPNNDVDDPTEAIVAISDYFSYLFSIPDRAPEYLDLIYATTCSCYDVVLGYLAEYAAKGWVQDDQGIVVVEVVVSQEIDNGDVLLQVTDTWSPQYVIDSSGSRIRIPEDEWENTVSLIGLELGADRRWRIGVIGVIGEEGASGE